MCGMRLGGAAGLAGQAAIQAEAQMEQLKADVARFQASSRSSHDNYERELQVCAPSLTLTHCQHPFIISCMY